MSGPSPSDAVALEESTAEGAADAAAEHAAAEGATESVGAEDMGGSSTSIKDALLHTEPRMSTSAKKEELGVDDAGAHAYIGIRKFVAGLGVGDGEGESGTPAIVHLATAGWHAFGPGADGGDDQEASDEVEAAGAIEGESEREINDPATAGEA